KGVGQCAVIIRGHDLSHTAAQSLCQSRHVKPGAHEDDAEFGPIQSSRLSQVTGLLERYFGSDHDLGHMRVVMQRAGHHRRRRQYLRLATQGKAVSLPRTWAGVPEDDHGVETWLTV